jgi:hypothetical protein
MTPTDAEMPDIPNFLDRTRGTAAKAAPLPPDLAALTVRRKRLLEAGYRPIPANGKAVHLAGWSSLQPTEADIEAWARERPGDTNTGLLTRDTPAVDNDVLDPDVATELCREFLSMIGNGGRVIWRVGQAPKHAFLCRTDAPFKKIATPTFTSPDGRKHRVEVLADGQQIIVDGTHPGTGEPYEWHDGEPGEVRRDELPYMDDAKAAAFIAKATEVMIARGWTQEKPQAETPGREQKYAAAALDGCAAELGGTPEGERNNKLNAVAYRMGRMVARGWMDRDAVCERLMAAARACGLGKDEAKATLLSGLKAGEANPHPDLEARAQAPEPELAPCTIDAVLEVFERWLILKGRTPVYAVLGAVAANLLPGDPVWLGLIAPPSSAKTEILNSISRLPYVVQASTITPGGLLSGSTPKKDQDKQARGGLLQQIGAFGIIMVKDFGSLMDMRPDTKAEMLAALREVFDGAFTRHLGTDGGRTLAWRGKAGFVFAATGAFDQHHSVITAMGDRYLLCRVAPVDGHEQFNRALEHVGAATERMRKELAEVVARLFSGRTPEPRPLSLEERGRIGSIVSLVVRLRGVVERDRYTREIEAVPGAEGTARLGLSLERLLAGLDTLGVDRETALRVVEAVALDSVPPIRRRAYEYVAGISPGTAETSAVAAHLGLPKNTVRRYLEDLAAYGLIILIPAEEKGESDLWAAALQR